MTADTPNQQGRNIVLSGMMGSGKSTIGRIVAELLGRPFVDTDKQVEETAGRSVATIFADQGEAVFRLMERDAVRHVAAQRGQVVSLGGGVVMDPDNVAHLRETGDIVWIDVPIDVLVGRLASSAKPNKRPLLEGDRDPAALHSRLSALRAERYDAYATSAVYVLDTLGRSSEVVAQEVLAWAMQQPGVLSPEERP